MKYSSPTPKQFRSWRKSHGFSVNRAADIIGMTRRTVINIETGASKLHGRIWNSVLREYPLK